MARRKKDEGLVTVLLASPWWVSVVVGCIGFIALRWVIPSIFAKNPVFFALATLSRSMAWLPPLGCGLIAAIVYVRTKPRGDVTEFSSRADANFAVSPLPTSVAAPPSPTLDSAWGRSAQNHDQVPQPYRPFTVWSLEALRTLEWKRFELLCAEYYKATDFRAETIRCGADGGIDIKLFKLDLSKPIAIVQCKAWNTQLVGVKEVRELLGVMAHEKVSRGIFLTTSGYTKDALAFGAVNPIQLLDGEAFLTKLRTLPTAQQATLLAFAFDGDYSTPTCASCGIKMIMRESKRGPFWGCSNYPRCKSTLPFRS